MKFTQEFKNPNVSIEYTWPTVAEVRTLPDDQLQRLIDWAESHWVYHKAQSRAKSEKNPETEFEWQAELTRVERSRDGEPTKADVTEALDVRKRLIEAYGIERLNETFALLVKRDSANRNGWRYSFEPATDNEGTEIPVQASEIAQFCRERRLRPLKLNLDLF